VTFIADGALCLPMHIQRQDILLIVLGIGMGLAFMLGFVAVDWWAGLVGIVCGAGGGTVAAIFRRLIRVQKA
jgi:hypothetical protein